VIAKERGPGPQCASHNFYLPFFLCRFFLSFFLRLCVEIFLRLRFRPHGTAASPVFVTNNSLGNREMERYGTG
jgi:hypothetical protein